MKLFDLHCDTAYEIWKNGGTLEQNSCQISTERAKAFDIYTLVTAIWSDKALSEEETWMQFLQIEAYLREHDSKASGFSSVLAVEGGKLLGGKLDRVDELYRLGVRILTLVWGGMCCIGGAYDDGAGLTQFGRDVVLRCYKLGILPDLSHASDAMFRDVTVIAQNLKKPVIASHSCSRAVYAHPRNLTDDMAKTIAESGGVIGVNLVREHLTGESSCPLSVVTDHILHLISAAGEETICLGCDFDGTDLLPDGIENVGDLPLLYDELCKNAHSERIADKVFYSNAQSFANRWIH